MAEVEQVSEQVAKPVQRAMTIEEIQLCFKILDKREWLIAKLAIVAGIGLGEIFALTWN